MKKFLISLLVFGVVVFVIILMQSSETKKPQVDQDTGQVEAELDQEIMEFPEPAPGAIVFDMKYRGLSGSKDDLRYNAYWGFGGREQETPFIKSVKNNGKELHSVYHPNFGKAQYSAVEVKDKKVVALYFDLNADEKFSDNEKILPVPAHKSGNSRGSEFVLPDFIVNTGDGLQIPFRALLQVNFYGDSSRPNCMWSPSCVLEGTSTINGKSSKLILYTSRDFSISFNRYGMCTYSLLREGEDSSGDVSRRTLSSIINHKGQFYHLKLYGSHEKDKCIRAVLEKYTGQTGELTVELLGKTKLTSRLSGMQIIGSEDETIQFSVSTAESKLPTGAYKLNRSFIYYGKEKDNEWRLDFSKGPEFTIKADKTSNIELGNPVLTVSAVDESKRYSSDVEERTTFSKDMNVYISRIIKGKAGELYGRFYQTEESSSRRRGIEPDIRILDKDGKEVVAAKIKYG